jgi:formate hydrogenlyase subunit 3/multisubunit Na+/H+ antiporter MnhD subunit
MVRTMVGAEAVVVAALVVLTRADRHLWLREVYCYAAAVVVVLFIIITSSITNTTKADAKPKRNKSKSKSKSKSAGILALRRMVVRMAVGVRAGSHRLRFWIARRASKIPAFISADVYLEQGRAQMND